MKQIIAGIIVVLLLCQNVFAGLIFSEILPNTDKDSEKEYIELMNNGDTIVFLSGSYITDISEKRFRFGSGVFLNIGEKRKFYRPQTRLLFNNSNEEIFLYNSGGILVDNYSYSQTIKGEKIIIFGGNTQQEANDKNTVAQNNSESGSTQGSGLTGSATIIGTGSIAGSGENIRPGGSDLEIFPEIIFEIQSGLSLSSSGIYLCKKKDCSVNLSVEKIFTGSYNKNNFLCEWNFGSGAVFSSGTTQKCNPGYVKYGSGIFDISMDLLLKSDVLKKKKKGFIIKNSIQTSIPSGASNSGSLDDISIVTASGSNAHAGSGESSGSGERTLTGIVTLDFQSPSYIIDKNIDNHVYNCDQSKEICKINFDLSNTFSGGIKESDYYCDWGFSGDFFAEQKERCNPNTVIFPLGTSSGVIKVYAKKTNSVYAEREIHIINSGYIVPRAKSVGSVVNRSSGGGGGSSSKISTITLPDIKINIQSGLDEDFGCTKELCSINLEYIQPHNNLACRWIFANGIYLESTLEKCNPGYVKYLENTEHIITLEIYQKDKIYNTKSYSFSIFPFKKESPKITQLDTTIITRDSKIYNYKALAIQSLLANPHGVDNDEYIEIVNNGAINIGLEKCFLDDILDGGSKKYIFELGESIGPGKIKRYYKYKTKININNTKEQVYLYCNGQNIDHLKWLYSVPSGYVLRHNNISIDPNIEEKSGEMNQIGEKESTEQISEGESPLPQKGSGFYNFMHNIFFKNIKNNSEYQDIIGNFSLRVAKNKSGLSIQGKTEPNIQIKIRIFSLDKDFFSEILFPEYFLTHSNNIGQISHKIPILAEGKYVILSELYLDTKIKIHTPYYFNIDKKYISRHELYVFEQEYKQSLKSRKAKKKTNITKATKNKAAALRAKNIQAEIFLQGRIGTKKISENSIVCYESCNINFNSIDSGQKKQSHKNLRYIWDFGNGHKYIGENPKYISYNRLGSYTLSLNIFEGEKLLSQKEMNISYIGKSKKVKKKKEATKQNNMDAKKQKSQELKNTNRQEEREGKYGIYLKIAILLLIAFFAFILLAREKNIL